MIDRSIRYIDTSNWNVDSSVMWEIIILAALLVFISAGMYQIYLVDISWELAELELQQQIWRKCF